MKKIRNEVYENLAHDKRVVAVVEAMARDDDFEQKRLISTCPKVSCQQTDPRFTEMMDRLMRLGMAIEADLRECALRFFATLRLYPENSVEHLQNFANIHDAWLRALNQLGIDEQAMALAGPPRSTVFELLKDLIPGPEVEKSAALARQMLSCLRQ